MDCETVEELAGAYALDAVPAEEAARVRGHLQMCGRCRELYRPLREAADLLPLTVEEHEPPARLRSRLMAAAALADVDGASAIRVVGTATTAPSVQILPHGHRLGFGPLTRLSRPLLALAAALLVAAGLGAWNVALHRDVNSSNARVKRQAFVLAVVAQGGRVVKLSGDDDLNGAVVITSDGSAAYLVGAMPAPPEGKAYEVWVIRDGQASAAGLVRSASGEFIRLSGDFKTAQTIALTLEPAAGSAVPTLPILARAEVSSG